jgi:fluoride ion exporter CrcB/FEX
VSALLVAIGGACGVMARYGIGKATLYTDALMAASVIGGIAAATCGYILGRKLA